MKAQNGICSLRLEALLLLSHDGLNAILTALRWGAARLANKLYISNRRFLYLQVASQTKEGAFATSNLLLQLQSRQNAFKTM
jgi:hypothetical protein